MATVFPQIVNYPVCLCKSLIRATWTFEHGGILFRMPRRNVNGESLRMKKRLLTEGTLEREIAFVFLHVIMHGVLFVLRDDFPTIWTDEIPVSIPLINVCHAWWSA